MAKKSEPQRPFRKIGDFADYQKARSSWEALKERQGALRQQVEALREQCGDANDIRTAAAQLLAGDASTATLATDRTKLEAAEKELEIVVEAVKQQQKIWSDLQREAQQAMAEERLERHRQLVAAIAKTLDAYQLAVEAETEFTEQLRADGGQLTTPLYRVFAQRGLLHFQRLEIWKAHMKNGGYC